jgi:hypothetical protein
MPKTINSPLSNLAAAADASSSSYSHSEIPLQVATPAEPKGDYIAERGYTRLRYISQQRRGIEPISHWPISLNKAHRATAFVSHRSFFAFELNSSLTSYYPEAQPKDRFNPNGDIQEYAEIDARAQPSPFRR